ncbi:hypothetical protein E2C01_036864 [Portunus trituberculatus]|uniref:Uncharacterized protein n=1 Tax=Portunus trituberculatus TaxID=210409 RepID=A0A5B7FCJ6_PORTR|nr:hypothetical protein [Portunus trituberculatus]
MSGSARPAVKEQPQPAFQLCALEVNEFSTKGFPECLPGPLLRMFESCEGKTRCTGKGRLLKSLQQRFDITENCRNRISAGVAQGVDGGSVFLVSLPPSHTIQSCLHPSTPNGSASLVVIVCGGWLTQQEKEVAYGAEISREPFCQVSESCFTPRLHIPAWERRVVVP